MNKILSDIWTSLVINFGTIATILGGFAATVVFVRNLFAIKKLRLEIEQLKNCKVAEKRKIRAASMDEIEKYGYSTKKSHLPDHDIWGDIDFSKKSRISRFIIYILTSICLCTPIFLLYKIGLWSLTVLLISLVLACKFLPITKRIVLLGSIVLIALTYYFRESISIYLSVAVVFFFVSVVLLLATAVTKHLLQTKKALTEDELILLEKHSNAENIKKNKSKRQS